MFVDIEALHMAGNDARRAGGHAHDGGDRLSRGSLLADMFGDFSAAEAVSDRLSSVYAAHVRGLHAHGEVLTGLGGKAYRAAAEFVDMDYRNAVTVQAGRCIFST